MLCASAIIPGTRDWGTASRGIFPRGATHKRPLLSITYSPPPVPRFPASWSSLQILPSTISLHCLCISCDKSWRIAVTLSSVDGCDCWVVLVSFTDPLQRLLVSFSDSANGSRCRFGLEMGSLCPLRLRGRSTSTSSSVIDIVCVDAFSISSSSGNVGSASQSTSGSRKGLSLAISSPCLSPQRLLTLRGNPQTTCRPILPVPRPLVSGFAPVSLEQLVQLILLVALEET